MWRRIDGGTGAGMGILPVESGVRLTYPSAPTRQNLYGGISGTTSWRATAPGSPPPDPPTSTPLKIGRRKEAAMRTFEFSEGASNKFWRIELSGNRTTVTF